MASHTKAMIISQTSEKLAASAQEAGRKSLQSNDRDLCNAFAVGSLSVELSDALRRINFLRAEIARLKARPSNCAIKRQAE